MAESPLPTVSVLIPAYNAATHLGRAIDSVLAQTHPPVEVLVIDDGSRDRTAEIAAAYPAPVRLIRKENGGPASARNRGAAEARGEWLALLDADDWWFPEKLARQLRYAEDPAVGMIHCMPDHKDEVMPAVLTFDDLWERNWVSNSSVMLRKQAFEELGGFNEAKELISVEDYNLWMRMAASRWRLVTCPEPLFHYTRGIGISSHSDRFLRASLFNLDDIATRFSLPADKVRRKRNQMIFDFGCKALFERDLPTARRLLRTAVKDEASVRNLAHFAVASLPAPVLDIRRTMRRLVEGRSARTRDPNDDSFVAFPFEADHQATLHLSASIVDRRCHVPASEAHLTRPVLITTIDAEEDFDWTRPFSRAWTDVTSMRSQHLAHRVFERHGVIPAYMVDFPVASQDAGRAPLRELLQSGLCDIGAQLHPWVTPPYAEYVSSENSYVGNLPPALEFAKVQRLTEELQAAFNVRPRIFRAGRYGVGPNTGRMLSHFGYQADCSVIPYWDFGGQGGPDFWDMTSRPFWIDAERTLLELPVSATLVGRITDIPHRLKAALFGRKSEWTGLPSILARLGLLERIKLTPEGITIEEAKRLARVMVSDGHKVFVLTYHTPSLEPGNTPYVKTRQDLEIFLRWLDEFYAFFTSELGGALTTWRAVHEALRTGKPIEAAAALETADA
ncbi:glycosyltransferase [Rhodopila sp.]|uniref:glycosyltransferase n=1 Tax=Rhodopila sp. TaxID=2480087 RepID=UPI002D14A03F|nr:glycosyltransferase [Rhodopila sp.]HVZ07704.1 glycosyltransferase [Rhodopila sp.]